MSTDTLGVKFLLEEYRNIAGTHDKLRDLQARIFNYFLLLSAFPFTLVGILYKDKEFNLLNVPESLSILFLIVGTGHLLLALSLVDARLSQYRYARTVNLVRKFFSTNDAKIAQYLYLPTTDDKPDWIDLGYIRWQRNFILLVGSLFTAYSVSGLPSGDSVRIVLGAVAFLVYWFIFYRFQRKTLERFQKRTDIPKE
jgi:hypothetical protein